MKKIVQRFLIVAIVAASLINRVQHVNNLSIPDQAYAQIAPDWDKSSLSFSGSCQAQNCNNTITAQVCNGAESQNMTGTSTYQVYYAASGNPKVGSVVGSGTIPALTTGQCTTLTYDTQGVIGNYMFRAFQRPGHPGEGDLWSTQCSVTQCVQSSPTPTPSPSPTPAPSPTPTPSPSLDPSPRPSPSPSPESSPPPSTDPTPTPGVGGRDGCYTSLANDRLACDQSNFDAIMDIIENGQGKKDILVRFSYNGANKEARTNDNGRAKVSFDFNGNGAVSADPDECSSQSMNITIPQCPNNNPSNSSGSSTNATPASTNSSSIRGVGQVLGATTLADTGMAMDQLAGLVMALGLGLTTISGLGYAYAIKR